jgi:ribosomal protein S27AE
MDCPRCHSSDVQVESLQEGAKRISCKKCGLLEILDRDGRKLLLDSPVRKADLLS